MKDKSILERASEEIVQEQLDDDNMALDIIDDSAATGEWEYYI